MCCYVPEAPRTVKIVCCSTWRAVPRWPAWQEADLMFSKPLTVLRFCLQHSRSQTCKLTFKANLLHWVFVARLWCHFSLCLTHELNYKGLILLLCTAPSVTCALTPANTLPAKDWCCCEVFEYTLYFHEFFCFCFFGGVWKAVKATTGLHVAEKFKKGMCKSWQLFTS